MPSKIVFFPGFLGAAGGGATRSACLQFAGLAEREVPVAMVGLLPAGERTPPPPPGDVRAYPATRHDDGARSPALERDLDDILLAADLVHINGAYDRLNHRIAGACDRAGVPYIVSPRSLLDPAALDVLPHSVRSALAADEVRYLESAFAVHFTARFEADRACLAGARPRRTVTIPNAVDLGQLDHLPQRQESRAHLGVPAQRYTLLYLGRLIAQKQPEFAVRALAETDPALDAHLYLVGWGDEPARVRLHNVAVALGVADRVHLVGHAAGADRDRWLAATDLLLLPSSAENFSLVLVEAVAAGVPAIVSPHIGVLELLRPQDARVVPLEPRAWASAIEQTAAAPPVPDRTAFHRLRDQLSSASVIPRWLELYRELPVFASSAG